MARYGSNDVKISLDTYNDSLTDISQDVTEFSGIQIEAMTEETHSFGDTWVENSYAGLKKVNDITLNGFYNNGSGNINLVVSTTNSTAGSPDIGNQATTSSSSPTVAIGGTGYSRTFRVTYNASSASSGSWATTQLEVIIKSYNRTPVRGELTKYELVLQPASSVTTDVQNSTSS